MAKELNIDKASFERDGYVVVKNVFTAEEINTLRKEAYQQYEIDKEKKLDFLVTNMKTKAKYTRGDLLSKELLRHALLDERILKIAKTILGKMK
ncbi:MAG: phytanoyl-CoA dioxygenase family protein [Bacteroidetes bacterium]|nr:phytanoyl-CoA dioxygenase family protein [Bacteroidota bacterium]